MDLVLLILPPCYHHVSLPVHVTSFHWFFYVLPYSEFRSGFCPVLLLVGFRSFTTCLPCVVPSCSRFFCYHHLDWNLTLPDNLAFRYTTTGCFLAVLLPAIATVRTYCCWFARAGSTHVSTVGFPQLLHGFVCFAFCHAVSRATARRTLKRFAVTVNAVTVSTSGKTGL